MVKRIGEKILIFKISKLQITNINKKKLLENEINNLEDSKLFVYDTEPICGRKALLKRKTDRENKKKPEKKTSKNEEKIIKRLIQKTEIKNKEKTQNVADLWAEEPTTKTKQNQSMSYPKVPLPHPGQSYNPSKSDITNLLHKVIKFNQQPEKSDPVSHEIQQRKFSSSSESSEMDDKFKVSNNPPVDDNERKTKKERKRINHIKVSKRKEKELKTKKTNKIKLANEKGLKRIIKERKTAEKIKKEKDKSNKYKQKEKEELIKLGVVEDADLLNDFQVNTSAVPLRKIKTSTSAIRERFDNILKRNIIGDFNPKEKLKKKNRKLNKLAFREGGINDEYGFSLSDDEKLKIFE